MKTYLLREPKEKSLGDKQEFHYRVEPTRNRIAEIEAEIKGWLSQKGTTAEEILKTTGRTPEEYELIRKHLGLTANKDRNDTYGFIKSILKRLSQSF